MNSQTKFESRDNFLTPTVSSLKPVRQNLDHFWSKYFISEKELELLYENNRTPAFQIFVFFVFPNEHKNTNFTAVLVKQKIKQD